MSDPISPQGETGQTGHHSGPPGRSHLSLSLLSYSAAAGEGNSSNVK